MNDPKTLLISQDASLVAAARDVIASIRGFRLVVVADTQTAVRQAMSVRDEGRSLGAGLRRQAPNHRERLGSRALVVSVPAKRHGVTVSGTNRKGDRKGTTDDVSKA